MRATRRPTEEPPPLRPFAVDGHPAPGRSVDRTPSVAVAYRDTYAPPDLQLQHAPARPGVRGDRASLRARHLRGRPGGQPPSIDVPHAVAGWRAGGRDGGGR